MPTAQKAGIIFALVCAAAAGIFVAARGSTDIGVTLNLKGPATTLDDGLVGHWTFDASEIRNNIADRSPEGNHGFLLGTTATTTSRGPIGQALTFDGFNDVVNVPYAASLNILSDITIATWIRRTSLSQGDILTKGLDDNSAWDYGLYLTSGNLVRFSSDTIGSGVNSVSELDDSDWYHVVVTRSGSTVTIYINGQSDASGTLSGAFGSGNNPVHIGKGGDITHGATVPGSLDDTRLYNRVLSAAEVQQLYLMGATSKIAVTPPTRGAYTSIDDNLLAHWTFDGEAVNLASSTLEITDSSGQGNHSDWADHASTTVRGVIGQAIEFDGTDDRIRTLNANSIAGNTGASVSLWFRPNRLNDAVQDLYYESNSLAGGSARFSIRIDTDNRLRFVGRAPDTDGLTTWVDSTTALQVGTWYHVVAVFDSVTDIHTVYINGAAETASVSEPAFDATQPIIAPLIARNGALQAFGGAIDDVRVYARAVTVTEVQQLYQMGATSKIATTPVQTGLTTSLDDGLVAHYTFDGEDTLQGQVNDRSGNGNHASQRNLATSSAYARGAIGQGLQLDGTDGFISAPLFTPTTAYTFCHWVKATAEPVASAVVQTIRSGSVHLNDAFSFAWNHPVGSTDQAIAHQKADTTYEAAKFTTPLVLNTWYHICGVWDGSELRAYLNGVNEATVTGVVDVRAPSGQLTLGESSNVPAYFAGMLDDVRIYNRALSNAEIQQLYQLGK
jgi:hypothetical protein